MAHELHLLFEICGGYGQLLWVGLQIGDPVVEQNDAGPRQSIGAPFSIALQSSKALEFLMLSGIPPFPLVW